MKHITSSDLATWAATLDGQSHVPLLVRKLIKASPVTIVSMCIPSGDNVNLPGVDGSLEIEGKYRYLPEGKSIWEIGTGKDFQQKANGEYGKRSAQIPADVRAISTFVFVTPLVWTNQHKWVEKKKKDQQWKDVVVIDGRVLEEWLEDLPAIAVWLARFLGHATANARTVDQWWSEWAGNDQCNLPTSLLWSRRQTQKDRVLNFLNGTAGCLAIQADSSVEATAFVVAVALDSPEEYREKWLGRALIIGNIEELRMIIAEKISMILIMAFDPGGIARSATANGHHLIVCLSNSIGIAANHSMQLPRLTREGLEQSLKEMGIEFDARDRLIRDSGLSLPVLRRHLGFDKFKQPEWAEHAHFAQILPALLLGSWDEQAVLDKKLISDLAGESYDNYIQKLTVLKMQPDTPVMEVRKIWRLTSPLDAWSALAPFVTSIQLDKLRECLLTVFTHNTTETDSYSHSLREGILNTLILISVFGESNRLRAVQFPQDFVDRLLKETFCAKGVKTDWYFWHLYLEQIAEASPDSFLSKMENDLQSPKPSLLALFEMNEYTHLLWALERLAFGAAYFQRVTLVLGALVQLDAPMIYNNSPMQSLINMHIPWYRQIEADFEVRQKALALLIRKHPAVGFDLFLVLMGADHTSPIAACQWRFNTLKERTVLHQDVFSYRAFLFQRLITAGKSDDQRMAGLVNKYAQLNASDRETMKQTLLAKDPDVDYTGNYTWNALRILLANHFEHVEQNWALPLTELEILEQAFHLYTPVEPHQRILYLFGLRPEFPREHSARGKWREHDLFLNEKREKCLKELYQRVGFAGLLPLLDSCENPRLFGVTLTQLTLTAAEELVVFSWLNEASLPNYKIAARTFCTKHFIIDPESFFETVYAKFAASNPSSQATVSFFLSLPPSTQVWDQLAVQDPLVQQSYWEKVDIHLSHHPLDEKLFIIHHCRSVSRHHAIINQLWYGNEDIPTELIVELLQTVPEKNEPAYERLDKGHLKDLFEQLQTLRKVEQETLELLEWKYIDLLDSYWAEGAAQTLLRKLTNDPEFFFDVIKRAYKQDADAITGEQPSFSSQQYEESRKARDLLNSWRSIPAMDEQGNLNGFEFRNWINLARELARLHNYQYGTDCQIGKMLAHFPRVQEVWPHKELCEVIDQVDSETMRSAFSTEIYNTRGAVVSSPYEGGQQDRSLATFFKKSAKSIGIEFPVTASELMNLAKTYEREGIREDERAHLDELR